MAERITSIKMDAFRGVPKTLTLELAGGRSCVVLGDNATGKSTIADALEWYFTGKIEFLSKEGRGNAIRHSGAAEDVPTKVTVSADGQLSGEITTAISSPSLARDVGRAELFLLRGHTLADFVNKTKGEKWQALAELLGLEAIDALRRDLQRVRNDLESVAVAAGGALDQKSAALASRVSVISEQGVLNAFQKLCVAANVDPPDSLEQALSRKWVPAGSRDQRAAALRAVQTDLSVAIDLGVGLDPVQRWNSFSDGVDATSRAWQQMYDAARQLLENGASQGACPLCHHETDTEDLKRQILGELVSLSTASKTLNEERQRIGKFSNELREAARQRSDVRRRALRDGVELSQVPTAPLDSLSRASETVSKLDEEIVTNYIDALASWDGQAVEVLDKSIPAPATDRDRALIELGVVHSKATAWLAALKTQDQAKNALALADRVFTEYQRRQYEHFQSIVEQISGRVAEIYRFLHPEDGVGAVAIEFVGDNGAELSIEFHGRKELPPHRVLSESHLNSLGVALFLAMAETFNDRLGFLVLDDIINSFDRQHRGRLAELLVGRFDGKQLIVLTHDEPFFSRISRLAPSWMKEHFTSWSYEAGPRTKRYEGDRLLQEAADDLGAGNKSQSAQLTRRALEEFLQEACERLEALLPFRRGQANDQRMADEVMKGLRRALKEHARGLYGQLTDLLDRLDADLQAALNVESHASINAASTQEIGDALERVNELRARFVCPDCGTFVWHKGTPASCRCKCGKTPFPPVEIS